MEPDPRDALVADLVELRSVINAAEARSAEITAELSALDDGHPLGCKSTVHFLSWQAGLSTGAAKALSDVGERFAELPSLHQAAAGGELSLWQAKAVASVAVDDADAADFVELARHTTCAQLEMACRRARRARRRGTDADTAARQERRLRTWWTPDGRFRIDGEADPEQGALLASALDAAASALPDDADRGATDRGAARQLDALGLLARAYLADSTRGDGPPPGHLSIHIALEALVGDDGDSPLADLCQFGWSGVGVSQSLALRLGCDAAVQAVIRDCDGNPLGLGRTRRVVNRRLRRALGARDGHCQAPNCAETRFLVAHHIVHWANGGPTDLDNLVLVCHWHHRMIHDGHLTATMINGRPRVEPVRPQPTRPQRPITGDIGRAAARAGVTPHPHAAASGYEGGSIDMACFDAAFCNPRS